LLGGLSRGEAALPPIYFGRGAAARKLAVDLMER